MSLALQKQLIDLNYTGRYGYDIAYHINEFNEILKDICSKDTNAMTDYQVLDIFAKNLKDKDVTALKTIQ